MLPCAGAVFKPIGGMPQDRKRIAVIGSRGFANPESVRAFVAELSKDTVVVSGAARGVDTWAEEAAKAAGIATLIFHADWDGLGRRAGPIRNEQIIAAADEVVAFWDGTSRGTLNAVYLATEKGGAGSSSRYGRPGRAHRHRA